ncbi:MULTISPECIES: DMT family transporter [unclassified Rhizobium]|uniref:DMT family transporter n=1 Tax=unclassified Rhizobium TaxID=2613769 RepID=UPI00177E76A7|nr:MULTISPECIES: EamA family transporter [unclassified Rhizobium]MBD8685436.1 EamA family transporter [Rhizobium sp. CFBP 13644]MBD8690891.1 EamA family transporter [Rhizobium sp. CFBP 13717]
MTGKIALLRELGLLLLLSCLWGSSYTLIKIGIESIPPITLIAARTAIAGAVLVAILYMRGLRLPKDYRSWRGFAIQAVLNSVVPFTLIAWAEHHIDAGLAVVLNSLTPVFTFLLTILITRHESTSTRKLFGVVLGLAGTVAMIGMEALNGLGSVVLAQFAVVVATVFYAGAAIFGKSFKDIDPMIPAAGSLICGAVMLVPVSIMVDRPWELEPSMASLLALVGLSVFSTAAAFTIYFRLMRTLGSLGATAQAYLRVPIGVAIGVVFLGEQLHVTTLIGLVCILTGVIGMTLPARRVSIV